MNTGISRGSLDAIEQDIITKNAGSEQGHALDMTLPGQSGNEDVGLSPIKSGLSLGEEVAYTAPGNVIEFPAIEDDKDFIDALDVYGGIPDLDPDKRVFGNAIADYQTKKINFFYDDPVQKAAVDKRQKKEVALDALTRDWKVFPDARKKAVDAFGEGFALNWEEATPSARANMGKNKVLEQLYSQDGDGEFDSWMRYKESHGLMGNVDVWKHYTEERGKAHQVEDAEEKVRRGFDSKMTPMVGALIQGKTFIESIDSIPDLTLEEKNWAYVNCGYGSEWYKGVVCAKEWAKETGVSFEYGSDETMTNQTVSELGRKLLYLKKKDEVAYRMVVGLALSEVDQARNDGTAFVSPFARTLMMSLDSSMDFFSRFTVGEFFEGDQLRVSGMGGAIQQNFVRPGREPEPNRFGSAELSEEKSQVRAMMAEIAESPDGGSWLRRTFDGLGKMSAQTAYYLGTQGVGTFSSVTNDRFDELYGNGGGFVSSLLRAGLAGGTEVAVERLGGEFFGSNLRWLAKKMPGVQKFSGYIGGATDMLKAGMYRQAGLRYGLHAFGSGASEWAEELIQPTLQAPLDSSIAYLFDEKNGMGVQEWKDQLRQACSPDLIFQMMVFGAACGVIQTPAMAREAKIARTSAGQIQTMTRCNEDRAKEIAKIVDPVEKRQAIIEEGFSNALSEAEQLGNMMNGINSMKEDFSWLSQQSAYQAEVDQLNLPHVEDLGDGKYRFTTSVKDEDGNVVKDVLELDEAAATARMNALLDDGIRSRMMEASNAFAVNEAVEAFAKSGKYVFEEMGAPETIASAKKLASAARLRIDEGANVSAPASDLGTQMSYGQATKLDTDFGNRAKLGVERGEVASMEKAKSNAYRVAMKNGQALIRFHKGEVTVSDLLEEVLETHLVEDMGNTRHEVGWYVDNLRALQKALTEEGYLVKGKTLIKEDGEATMKDVIEGMSMLAKGDVMARATEMRIPEWLKDFVQMVRQWVSSAKALLDLGTGLHEMERRRLAGEAVPISEDFAETVYALSNNLESYWMQEGVKQGEIAVKEIEGEVGGGMSASLSVDGNEIDLRKCKAVDQNGRVLDKETFITTPNGGIDWFRFPADEKTRAILKKKGIADLPIRLKVGKHKDVHNGFGWMHTLNHLDDMLERGVTPLQFLYDTVTNMTGMYDQARSRKTFKSEKSFAEGSLLHVDLIESEGCYSIVTCYPVEGNRKPSGNELLIGRALFRFSPNSEANPFGAAHSPNKTVMRGVDATGKALEARKAEEASSVNIYDVMVVDKEGRDIYKQEPVSDMSFSLATPELSISRGNVYPKLKRLDSKMSSSVGDLVTISQTSEEVSSRSLSALDDDSFVSDLGKFVNRGGDAPSGGVSFSVVAMDQNGNNLAPETFVTKQDGNPDWFVIPKRKGQEAMPVRLLVGEDNGNHKGYGLTHIVASRDGDSLWDKISPEKYLSDVMSNISELWEIVPGRELLVKGKRPSSWVVLQMENKKGYYSIVTAYPVNQKQKPKGRKLPLVERTSGGNQRDTREEYLSTNPDAVPGAFGRGATVNTALLSQFAGEEVNNHLSEGIDSVNIKDVTCRFDDGSTMPSSFSLAAPELSISRGTQSMEIVRRISDELRADVATWGRYDGKTDEAAFLVNVGKNIAMVKSALMHLPAGKRVRVKPFIDRLQILAELAATGRIDETAAVNAFAKRELGREMKEAIEEEIRQLKQEAARDIEATNNERLAEKKGELNEKTEALYKSLDYEDRTAVKKAYNERNQRIISIRKRYKDEGYISQRIERENAKFDKGIAKYQTREEKLTAQITKLEARINSLKAGNVSDKRVNDASREAIKEVRKAWAEKRLNQLMAEVMTTACVKLDEVAKEGIVASINKMLDSVLTIKVKNGSQKRGKMSVEAYNYLKRQVRPMLEMKAGDKEKAINEAQAELAEIEKENPDQMDADVSARIEELNEELTMLVLYGDLKGMSVDEAETAAKAIELFIRNEKEAWAVALEHDAQRLNAAGRKIVDEFNRTGKKASENTLRAANKAYHGNVSLVKIGDFMENMDQLFKRMAAVPAMKDFAESMRGRLSNAFQQMRDSSAMRAAEVQDIYETNLTGKVLNKRGVGSVAGWVEWFKTSHDTGVSLSGWVTREVKLTLAEARELREMNAQERREYVQARWEGGKKHVSDEMINVLLGRLEEYETSVNKAEQEGRRPRFRKYVTANVSVKSEDSVSLAMSRDNALQAILLSEQEEYLEQMKGQGYTPEVLSALREYVGEEGIAIGYALRDLLKLQGEKIGKLYEMVTGVPFPRVQNYYPARFWALDAMSDADAADMISGVPTSKGTAKGWQKVRTKHNRRLDTSVGALSVFFEASDITDHWYYTQDIITDLRGITKRREVAESLVANIGKDDFVRLRRWIDLLERAGVVQGQAVGALDKTLNAIYSGQAKAILAFRVETMLKQGSAVLNAWIGDSSIGMVDYFTTMAKLRNGTARMGIIKMMKSAEFQARLGGKLDIEKLSRLRDDQSYTFAESLLALGMNGIEAVDMFSNAVGSAALWNIKFRQAVKAGLTEEIAEAEAWQAVRDSLHSAQPQMWVDKSFGGLNRGAFGRSLFYMMSENFSKTAIIYGQMRMAFTPRLTKKERWKHLSHGAKVWLAYGAANALIGMVLDYFKDDEDEWEERDIQGYLFAALAGPVSGMPLIGEALEATLAELFDARVYTGSAGKAFIDFGGGYRAGKKLLKMMEEGDAEASDYMKQIVKLGRVFGAVGGVASATADKGMQVTGQYMTLGAALMNPVKTVVDVKDSVAVNK